MNYGFICKECQHWFDKEMKLIEYRINEGKVKCPKCGGETNRDYGNVLIKTGGSIPTGNTHQGTH